MYYMIYFFGFFVSKFFYRKIRYIFCYVLVCRVREIQYSLNEKMFVLYNKRKIELLNYYFYSVINMGVSFILIIGKLKLLLCCWVFFLYNIIKYRINIYFFF